MTKMIAKPVVVKIGSSVLLSVNNTVSHAFCESLVFQIAQILRQQIPVVLVMSGAIAAGRSHAMHRSVAAGIGQATIIASLYHSFAKAGIPVAQVLLTRSCLNRKSARTCIAETLSAYTALGIVPILNENDVVSPHSFGGNDILAGEVARALFASHLIMLSNVDGVLDVQDIHQRGDMLKGTRIPVIRHINADIRRKVLGVISSNGTGGMKTKLDVAAKLQRLSIVTIIANGRVENILPQILIEQKDVGTRIVPK